MHLARLAALQHQADLGARPLADQVMVHPGDGQQRRDRGVLGVDAAVRQDEDVVTLADRRADVAEQPAHRQFEADRPLLDREEDRQRDRLVAVRRLAVERPQLLQLLVLHDRRGELDLPGRPRRRLEQVVLGAEGRLHRHDDFFADAIDRRVGDLREELLEVVVEQLRPVREDRQGGVVAHRADRLVPVHGHRREQDLQVLAGVAERLLPPQERGVERLAGEPNWTAASGTHPLATLPGGNSSSATMLSRSQSA